MAQHQRLPMLPAARPVDPQWTCQKSGDCCTIPDEVVMTTQERTRLMQVIPQGIVTHWRETMTPEFVALKAGPCPLFVFKTCLVYEDRPYNCRRFGCMRPDVKAEPFEADGSNMLDRVKTSRPARRLAERMQRKAQRWARSHGWDA